MAKSNRESSGSGKLTSGFGMSNAIATGLAIALMGLPACAPETAETEGEVGSVQAPPSPDAELAVEVSATAENPNFVRIIGDSRAIYHTEILIDAPVEDVWAVATGSDMEWSPTFRGFAGTPEDGERMVPASSSMGRLRPCRKPPSESRDAGSDGAAPRISARTSTTIMHTCSFR